LPALNAFSQQDPQYNMYMFNQLAINPAYAGSKDALSTTLLVRNQWTSFIGAPKTSVLSIHAPIRKKFIGLGGYVFTDAIGPKKVTGVYGTYSFRMKVGNGMLSLGLGTGLLNYNFNWNEINFKDQGDLNTYYQNNNRNVFDFTSGAYYQTTSFYAGIGATHLNRAKIFDYQSTDSAAFFADYRLNQHLFFTIGKGFKLGEDYVLNPSLVVKYYGNSIPSVDLNVNFNLKKKLWLGMSLRSDYGFVLLTQYNITEKFRVGYSLDGGRNRIGRAAGLSHEILLGYNFNIYHSKIVSPRFL
jgi:type IX secretion system PorP/SprF family membrane protein